MDIASRVAEMSYAVRRKVGCVIVKDGNIISMGWNGMPAGMTNNCEWHEMVGEDFNLVTRPEVSHAEENAIAKIAKSNTSSLDATLYVTTEPCMHCAKLIYSSGIKQVIFRDEYKIHDGTKYLREQKIDVYHWEKL